MKILIIFFVLLFASACASDGSFVNPLSGMSIETPGGKKLGCTRDLVACTETCTVQTPNGLKINTLTKLSPEVCNAKETKAQPAG